MSSGTGILPANDDIFLAIDLGASSGRAIAGWLDDTQKIQLHEIHRFENIPVKTNDTLCWDFEMLMTEITTGIQNAFKFADESNKEIRSIGIDSWAVDFGLVHENGNLIAPIVHYRDERTGGQKEKVFEQIPKRKIYEETGIQFLPFNTIYQLAALNEQQPEQLNRARHFMMIADLVAWRLTDQMTCEYTNATTTQLFDARRRQWSDELFSSMKLPREIFPKVIEPGAAIGPLLPEVAVTDRNVYPTVVAVATHDTASAVAAVPASNSEFAYLSCGTWSLLGTELTEPIITDEALEAGFTNEGGVYGTIRFLKNIMGLWILQECRRQWALEGRDYDWPTLEAMAKNADDCGIIIDVDDMIFLPPDDMPARVRDYCRDRATTLSDDSAIVRCLLKSLAARYAEVLNLTEKLTARTFDSLHIVGGGSRNELLCQWTAEAIRRPVISGPVEATAIGNIGVQMITAGKINGITELRSLVSQSFPMKRYDP